MNDAQREVALFRYSLVREAADDSLTSASAARSCASSPPATMPPDERRVRVGRGTVDRWIRAYRAGGFDALAPVARAGEPVTEKACWTWPRR